MTYTIRQCCLLCITTFVTNYLRGCDVESVKLQVSDNSLDSGSMGCGALR